MRNVPKTPSKAFCEFLIATSCLLLVTAALYAASDEGYPTKPPQLWTEEDALNILNDSPWAKTVKPSAQDTACGYKNPAIPGGFTEDEADKLEIRVPTDPAVTVKPDGAEYLIRWHSARPMQAAVQRLLALGEQWKEYGFESSSTNVPGSENYRSFTTGMVGISVILKHKGPEGESFLDYLFDPSGKGMLARRTNLWPCAGLKTEEGVTFAQAEGHGGEAAITLFFPSAIHGRPLFAKTEEKVEFRFVARQRVFETTFAIRAEDLVPDQTEPVLYYPIA